MTGTIAQSWLACIASFHELLQDTKNPYKSQAKGLQVQTWRDELGRLRVWALNVGAYRKGPSSLDFRLRTASHIRAQTIDLLSTLRRRVEDARSILADFVEGTLDEAFVDEGSDEEEAPSELEELRQSVATIIKCLFRMSMLIRNPAPHDLLIGANAADAAAFARFDYNHVRDKFPRAEEALISRLASAITRRRQSLKYFERHAADVEPETQNVNQNVHQLQSMVTGPIEITQNRSGARAGAGDTVTGIEESYNQDSDSDDSQPSYSSYALSDTVASDTSVWGALSQDQLSDFGASQTSYTSASLAGGVATIPSPPKASENGAAFECPYCYSTLAMDDSKTWIAHVFQDLQPYVCVDLECITPNKLYTSKDQWLCHTEVAHPRSPLKDSTTGVRIAFSCPLCKDIAVTGNPFVRHLARHLQELALFALPRGEQKVEMGDSGSSGSSASSSGTRSSAAVGENDFYDESDASQQRQQMVIIDDEKAKDRIASIIDARHSQTSTEDWHTDVSPSQRIDIAHELYSKLRPLPAVMNIIQEIQIITNFEERTFLNAPDAATYEQRCREKIDELNHTGAILTRSPPSGIPQHQDFVVPPIVEPTTQAAYEIDSKVSMRMGGNFFLPHFEVVDQVYDQERDGWNYLLRTGRGEWHWRLIKERDIRRPVPPP